MMQERKLDVEKNKQLFKKKLSVVVFAHNEAERIYEMVSATVTVLSEAQIDFEILIVNDGSTDSTPSEIERLTRDFSNVSALTVEENIGKATALMRGFWKTKGDIVCFIDPDPHLDPSHILTLLKILNKTGSDVVIGSRRHPQSRLDYRLRRRIFSTIYNFLTRIFFNLPLKETQAGIKIFKKEVLEQTFPRILCMRYAMDLELLAVASRLGYKIEEAPIDTAIQGKLDQMKWADVRNIAIDTLAVFYRMYISRYYDSQMKPPAFKEPYVSIVIPTKSFDKYTYECVEKCSRLDYSNFDIWVLPDSGLDFPPELSRIENLRVIPSGEIGPSAKRNVAVRQTEADIVAFIDSDAWPDAMWLRNAVRYFESDEIAAVCGPAVTPSSDTMLQRAGGLVYTSPLVSGDTTYRYIPHAMREVDDYPSCNLLTKRSELNTSCAFPEEFWPGEDTVLCLKLTKEKGKKIIYVPNVTVYHHRRPLFIPHLKQVFSYALHRGYFVKRFPETSRRLKYFVPSIFVAWLILGLLAGVFFKPLLYAYLAVLAFYLLLCALSSVKSLEPIVNLLVFPGIILSNLTYGTGFLIGLFKRRLADS